MWRTVLAIGLCSGVAGAAAPAAAAFTTVDPAWSASDFATGFASSGGPPATGPTGATMGPDGSVYVSDFDDGFIYKFGAAGGGASAMTRLNSTPLKSPVDVQFTGDGRLYVTQEFANVVTELDPSTGAPLPGRNISVPDPAGLAQDPVSGDLFVSEYGPGKVARIQDPTSATPTVTDFATGIPNADGLAPAPDGTLYASSNTASNAHEFMIDGTAAATPGTKHDLTTFPAGGPDGIVIGFGFVLINRNDGVVTKVTVPNGQQSEVASGGSRGDIAKVGSNGCGYLTQSDTVVKLTAAGGGCSLIPAVTFGPPASCTLKPVGSKVAARARAKPKKQPAGLIKLTATCNQTAALKLSGRVTAKVKKKGKPKPAMKKFVLARVKSTALAGRRLTLTLHLPKPAIAALKAGAREAATFTLTVTNLHGKSGATATIARLKRIKR